MSEVEEDPAQLLAVLATRKADWAATPLEDKYQAALEIRSRVLEAASRWSRVAAHTRGCSKEAVAAQELPLMLVPLANYLDNLLVSLAALKACAPLPSPPAAAAPGGDGLVVKAHPWGTVQTWFSLLGWSTSTEVTLASASQGAQLRAASPAVAVVRSVGYAPVESLAAALHLAFVSGAVVGLVLPAWQAPLQLVMEYIMDPLARGAFFATLLAADDAEATALTSSPAIDRLHLVGFTPDDFGALAEAAGGADALPPLVSGEVHGPAPWIVAPGPWTQAQLAHHSQVLAEAAAYAGGASPYAARLVLLPTAWEQADAFVDLVRGELAGYKLPAAVDPGVAQRHADFRRHYPDAFVSGAGPRNDLIPGVGPCPPWVVNVLEAYPDDPASEPAFQTDPRGPVLTIIATDAGSEEELLISFLDRAVRAVNEDVQGSFGMTLVAHGATQKRYAAQLDAALAAVRYGVVVVNANLGLGLWSAQTHWGVHGGAAEVAPGRTLRLGSTQNSLLYDEGVKGVVRFPFETYLHILPPEYRSITMRASRQLAVGIVDGMRGFLRGLKDKSWAPPVTVGEGSGGVVA
ncbi:hypothetical protein APUTEX25_003177 [Auxenochlorella protothecoides]|uniref:Aldehyde dehydrogenase domain-containing protein n=1 Tax=Auxenochlorella protothecoides TaxID=3075 RepID=A0A3M7KSY8_AUXPR|nr:hypothetical protein APUTEX25_003177 [Auxenochlorella protothecoides]|eukprot:RMZ53643.1 hypothetical protein APUTEX25_003177 [Auxenochlorella protothecoides]